MTAQLPAGPQSTLVRRFLAWSRLADSDRRADAANALARAYLYSEFDEATRREAEFGLYALLDDPSSNVRRALAEGLSGGGAAPPAMILALANDEAEVAAIVLARSPVLTPADLVDCAAVGDLSAQVAIAGRPSLDVGVSAALAEIGARDAIVALLDNPTAAVAPLSLARIAERFGADVDIADRLIERQDLPPAARHDLAGRTAGRLSDFVASCGWLSLERAKRIAQDSCDRATLTIGANAAPSARSRFLGQLRRSGGLTTALLLRSALTGDQDFTVAALAELSGAPAPRIAALIRDPKGGAFAALTARAGLSPVAALGLCACLDAAKRLPAPTSEAMTRNAAEAALAAVAAARLPGADDLAALLRRFAAEAAREEARAFVVAAQAQWEALEAPEMLALPAPADEPEVLGQAAFFDGLAEDEDDAYIGSVTPELGPAIPVIEWPGEADELLEEAA